MPYLELRKYQEATVTEIIERKNVLIVAPMGAGKTLSTLAALYELVVSEQVRNVLIVAPKRVAESVWVQEAERFGIPLNIRYCKCALDVKLHLLDKSIYDHSVAVVSVTRLAEVPHGCWDCVVMDESTLFKHKQSARSKEIRRICNRVPRRIELTGTPVHNGYENLFHQCLLLDGGKALGKSLTEFRRRYCREKYRVNGVVTIYEVDPVKVSRLIADCKHLIYVVGASVELPELLYKDITVSLPTKVYKDYKRFEETNVLTFKAQSGDEAYATTKTLLAFCRTSLGMKLRQFASGYVYADDQRQGYETVHTEKIAALKEIAECYDGGILVAYQFQSEYEEIKKAFPKARRIERDADIKEWNEGRVPMALVHPASCGHGLNLQFGGHVLVWFSLTYDAELYAQLNKRLHRYGQKDTVSILHLIAAGTIDDKILRVIQKKQNIANTFNTTIK